MAGVVKSKDTELASTIATVTGFGCTVTEVPQNATAPFFVVHPIATTEFNSTIGDPNSLAELMYQVDTVGVSVEQVEEAEYRMMNAVNLNWSDIETVIGPPSIRRSGTVREDDRTYKSMSIICLKVSS